MLIKFPYLDLCFFICYILIKPIPAGLTLFFLVMGPLANSEDPDEMLHKVAFHQGLQR